MEKANNVKVDLLLICGDFQAVRNRDDLKAMAVPPKYKKLNTFHKYYSGEKVAPVLTVFIGGNHEASNYMQELTYGGWVAKNIYYRPMGYANVIEVGGLRIGGLSGIYKVDASHITIKLVEAARAKQVILLKLPSNSTSVLQPLDVSVYGPVKVAWDKILVKFARQNLGTAVTKELFPNLIRELWAHNSVGPDNIKAGFKKCGLVPFNPAPLLSKCDSELTLVAAVSIPHKLPAPPPEQHPSISSQPSTSATPTVGQPSTSATPTVGQPSTSATPTVAALDLSNSICGAALDLSNSNFWPALDLSNSHFWPALDLSISNSVTSRFIRIFVPCSPSPTDT
ncbi:hypothetical protein ACOMHN_030063 [Nucella lapillus]